MTGVGFVTNFFDTLGIGSFAPTISLFKLLRLVPDERIPGTLNVGHLLSGKGLHVEGGVVGA